LLTWIAAAALPLMFNYRLVPFFVVVGAPIAVLNLHAFFARRPFRKGVTFASAETPASGEGVRAATSGAQEGWWPGASEPVAAPTTATTAPATKALGGELTMTPDTMLAMGGIMGRLLTVVVGLAAIAACWPGWLHSQTRNPRRVVGGEG
jgi:hypothetical protein